MALDESDIEAIYELTREMRKLREAIEKIWAIPVPYSTPQPQPWVPPVPMPYWQSPVWAQGESTMDVNGTLYNR